ncbi:hypothetical protein RGQ29_024358 [Quercus rubra]|uniref:tRNA-splicing endonuclease subunit Sen54 N-terminal domain-containing protein n=1 Tax=Quercus rubra TaxID=3512 RepID=A0AAN7EV54_QUERU|nr:hypothetical protein RGQ29_024358 [Quercus rubra]
MEAVDWENSSGGSSDTEAYLQDTKYEDDEELHFTSGFISQSQFRKDKSRAHWINEIGTAELVENKGKLWRTMGVVRSGEIYYSIEETLFLMEIGVLLLLDDNGTSLSLNDIYAKVSGGYWELFEVYRHLKSLGYIVGQHGIAWSIKDAKMVDLESEDESSIVGPFNNMHINEARPVFDVYLPNSKFRKSSPGDPSFMICLTRVDLPSIADIEFLERQCGAIPLRFCHVEYGRVRFFGVVILLPYMPVT